MFGRSHLIRDGTRLYYLKWQWKPTMNVNDMIMLTQKQYTDIKNMLHSIKATEIKEVSPISNSVIYKHGSSSKNYMRVKRYLIKNGLLK